MWRTRARLEFYATNGSLVVKNSHQPPDTKANEEAKPSVWTQIRNDPFSLAGIIRILWQHYVVPPISRWPWPGQIVVVAAIILCVVALILIPIFPSPPNGNGDDVPRCDLAFDGFHARHSLQHALTTHNLAHLGEDLLERAENLCSHRQHHVYWGTLLLQADASRHRRVIDARVTSSSSSTDVDTFLLIHPIPYESPTSAPPIEYGPLDSFPRPIENGIAIDEIELEETHGGAIFLICAGDALLDERIDRESLELDITRC